MRIEAGVVEFTPTGNLYLPESLACRHFPNDSVVAVLRGSEMWIMPTHDDGAGGCLMKRRTAHGDRTVLIWEALGSRKISGRRPAFWDEGQGALRVALRGANG